MTREEAIANLKMISVAFVEPVTKEQRKLIDDTFDVAIKALEQLTSYERTINKLTEAISEQATILDNLLIIKYPYLLSEKEADYFYKKLLAQKAKGLVIIPAGCEAVYIPHDCEIVMETEGDGKHGQTG